MPSASPNAGGGSERSRKRARSQQDSARPHARRAPLACSRCRVKKLRCLGGWPCEACERAEADCSFSDGREGALGEQLYVPDMSARMAQLEKTVEQLVAGLGHLIRAPGELPQHGEGGPPTAGHSNHSGSGLTPVEAGNAVGSAAGRLASDPILARANRTTTTSSPHDPLGESPESRLAQITQPGASVAPFRPLMYHPMAWSGRPRSPSPEEGSPIARKPTIGPTYFEAQVAINDDPISRGMIDVDTAREMFDFFFAQVHTLFPVMLMPPFQGHLPDYTMTRNNSPFLFTTILAIAANFWTRNSRPNHSALAISPEVCKSIVDLSYSHLSATLFRKQHQLADVQAGLMLAVWPLRIQGTGPDQWLVTGQCLRIAYRINLHHSVHDLSIVPYSQHPQARTSAVLRNALQKAYVWLTMYSYDTFLSLGLGRPLSFHAGKPNEDSFLATWLHVHGPEHVETSAVAFSVSLVQLAEIARDTLRLETLSHKPTVLSTISRLNKKLDDWNERWLSHDSESSMLLGHRRRLANLYFAHVDLCINCRVFEHEAGSQAYSESVKVCLRRTHESAAGIIQTYVDSSFDFGNLYLIMTVGQAAICLVRLCVSPFRDLINIMETIGHVQAAVTALLSERFGPRTIEDWVGRTVKQIARSAGFTCGSLDEAVNNTDTSATDAIDAWNLDLEAETQSWESVLENLWGGHLPAHMSVDPAAFDILGGANLYDFFPA